MHLGVKAGRAGAEHHSWLYTNQVKPAWQHMKQSHKIKDVLFYIYCRFPNIKLTDNGTVSYTKQNLSDMWYFLHKIHIGLLPIRNTQQHSSICLGLCEQLSHQINGSQTLWRSVTARRVLVYRLRTERSCCVHPQLGVLTLGNSNPFSLSAYPWKAMKSL